MKFGRNALPLISEKNRALLFKQLEHLASSGVPHLNTLVALEKLPIYRIQERIEQLRQGFFNSESLEGSGFKAGLFSIYDKNCLSLSQNTGRNDIIYRYLSQVYTARVFGRRRFMVKVVCPFIIMLAAIFIGPIPRLFNGSLSAKGYVLGTLGSTMKYVLLFYGALNIIGWIRYGGLKVLNPVLDRLQMLPILCSPYTERCLLNVMRFLSALLAAGIPIVQAWEAAINIIPNQILKHSAEAVSIHLRKGETLTKSVSSFHYLDPMLRQFIATGEVSGNVDTLLAKFVVMEAERIAKENEVFLDWAAFAIYITVILKLLGAL